MKCLLVVAGLLLSGFAGAQDSSSVDLHLSKNTELRKAAWNQSTSAWWLLFGAAFTYVAASPEHIDEGTALPTALGALTLGGFVTFQLNSARHLKRAAEL